MNSMLDQNGITLWKSLSVINIYKRSFLTTKYENTLWTKIKNNNSNGFLLSNTFIDKNTWSHSSPAAKNVVPNIRLSIGYLQGKNKLSHKNRIK